MMVHVVGNLADSGHGIDHFVVILWREGESRLEVGVVGGQFELFEMG